MFDGSPENTVTILTIASSLNGVYLPFRDGIRIFRTLHPNKPRITRKSILPLTKDLALTIGPSVLVIIVSLAILSSVVTPEKPSTIPIPDKKVISLCTAPVTSWPIKRSVKDRWLDEMDSKVSSNGAFFMNEWNAFDSVAVKHHTFPHSVGVSIPLKDQKKYRAKINSGQLIHDEYIEYSLGFEYETLQFDFGIDDLSFPEGIVDSPYCQFKIIVDACDSKSYYSSKQKHLFETDWLDDQCCLWRTPEMDVSSCEAVRITIMWQFFPRYNGPIALNVAIANPILRAEKIE